MPAAAVGAEFPYFDLAVTSTGHQPPGSRLVAASTGDLSRRNSRSPGYAVDATSMSLEKLMCPVVVLKFEYGDVAVGGSTCE